MTFVMFLWVLSVFAAVGIAYSILKMTKPTDLFHQEFREKRGGFPDLLRHERIVGNGVILGKGGEFIVTYRYRGPDVDCASTYELNFVRSKVDSIIRSIKGGWMVHITTNRVESMKYAEDGAFPDAVTRAIDLERRKQYMAEGSHHENDFYITLTYLPDPLYIRKIKEFAYDVDNKESLDGPQLLDKRIQQFEAQLNDHISALQGALSENLSRLKPIQVREPYSNRMVWVDEQLSFLHFCITGIKQRIRVPYKAMPCGVDYILGSYPFYGGIKPRIDKNHIRVIAIESPPDVGTNFGMLDVLNKLPIEYRWTTRWIARSQEKVKAEVTKIRSKWRQKIYGPIADFTGKKNGPINQDAKNTADDAEAVLNDINSGSVAYGHWTSTVVLMHWNEKYIDELADYVVGQLRDMHLDIVCRIEEVNCIEAYLGSIPGHGYENVRMPMIHSLNLTDMIPLTSTWQGPTSNPCEFYKKFYPKNKPVPPLLFGAAAGGTPFRVVLHNGDLGHTLLIGPPGSGKSTKLALISASQFRYPEAKVIAFDKGESLLALCLASGGAHYGLMDEDAIDSSIGFAPFSMTHRLSDRTWAADYIESLMVLHEVRVDIDVRNEIKRSLDLLSTRPAHMRTFTELAILVQSMDLRQVLNFYELQGCNGMLNKQADTIRSSRFTVFEIGKLMELSERHVVPVLLYIFRLIERGLDGSPTLIIMDEGWLALSHEMFSDKLREWLKVLRKENAAVIFATQELQDVSNSPIASTLFSACQTKILLPNAEALSEENIKLYKNIGLTQREIELLSHATPKRDYFFKSPSGRRMYQLELGPLALAFVGISGVDDRNIIKQLYRLHGGGWVEEWLKLRDVSSDLIVQARNENLEIKERLCA